MGHINRFNLQSYINEYNTTIFVETGTGVGCSLQHVLKFPFEKIYTIEIVEKLYNKCKEQFKTHANCNFINNNSKNGLLDVLNQTDKDKNVCYWLDAHFPGANFGTATYDSVKDITIRIPLENEIKAIVSTRDTKNDVLIIDDLRIYEDGPFESGNWVERKKLGGNGINFIYESFDKTHNITKNFWDQGYIVITPKKYPLLRILHL